MKIRLLILSLISIAALPSYAHDYKEIGECGSAAVVSGDTCSNVKVELKFENCKSKLEPQPAKRIICDKSTIKARLQQGSLRYEASFEKKNDGWGGVNWKPIGKMKQYERVSKKQTI